MYIALLAIVAIIVVVMQTRDDEFVLTLVRCRECKEGDGGLEWEGVFRNNSKHEVFIDDLETGTYLLYILIEGKWRRCPQGCDIVDSCADKRISVGVGQEVGVSFRVYVNDPNAQWFAALPIYLCKYGEAISLCASGIVRMVEGGSVIGPNYVFKELGVGEELLRRVERSWIK